MTHTHPLPRILITGATGCIGGRLVPIMLTPRWVNTRTQPIGIREVLAYLATTLTTPQSNGRIARRVEQFDAKSQSVQSSKG